MYRVPLVAVAALALAIVTPSGPSNGADLSCSESEVRSQAASINISAEHLQYLRRRCVQRKTVRELRTDHGSRVMEVREIGRKRSSDLISQRETSLVGATKPIMEKWNHLLAERSRRFFADRAGVGSKGQEAARARDKTHLALLAKERRQTVRVWRDDSLELRRNRAQEVRETRNEIRACYSRQIVENRKITRSLLLGLGSRLREALQDVYAAPLDDIASEPEPAKDRSAEIYGKIVGGTTKVIAKPLATAACLPYLGPLAPACGVAAGAASGKLGEAFQETLESLPQPYIVTADLPDSALFIDEETQRKLDEAALLPQDDGIVVNALGFLDDPCSGNSAVAESWSNFRT